MLVLVLLALARGPGAWAASLSLPIPDDLHVEEGSWSGIARCAMDAHPLDCVESRSQRAVDIMLAPGGRAASGDTALEPEVVDKIGELSEIIVEAAASVLEKRIGLKGDDGDSSRALEVEGRGKKKKKIHKLIALVKLVLLVLVVKLKLAFLMMALQTLFQFKLVVMVFLILLCKKISLWAQLKNKHQEAQKVMIEHYGCLSCGPRHDQSRSRVRGHGRGRGRGRGRGHGRGTRKAATRLRDGAQAQVRHEQLELVGETMPQQVIYYEHAQHQHHYDDHGWTGGHDEHAESGGGGGGGWSGLWGRSYDTLDQQQTLPAVPAGTDAQTLGVQSGVYRAADGTRIVIRPPDAHDMAYSAQRPTL